MPQQWDADIQFTEQDVALLITEQFPELAPAQIVMLGIGWDNTAFLVDEHLVFRFPRRLVAASLLEREVCILPLLAPHLPAPIPAPTYVGTPTAAYPYVFAGYPLLPGRTACHFFCSDQERTALALPIARFLAALHHSPIDAETRLWAPHDDIGRALVGTRAAKIKERLTLNGAGLDAATLQFMLMLVDELATTPLNIMQPRWVHGDFYARHLVLDEARRLAGVIDWGDVHLGDPAIDLSIAFSFLPPAARPMFRQAYGEIDDATWRRARFRAIHYGAMLVEYGMDIADPVITAIGTDALKYAPYGE